MIEKLIKKIARNLDKREVPYMIIGGQAVLLYGTPRLTRDIDITLGVDSDEFTLLEDICRGLKLKILPENPEKFAADTKVLPVEDRKLNIRVDFIFSFTPYEKQAIGRARKILLDDYPVKFASCEDVVIHKMFAARAVDIEDVNNILVKNRAGMDLAYIRRWLSKFNKVSGQEGVRERFEALLAGERV